MKTFLNAIKKYFADFGTAVAKGDIWCKLSLLVMGAGDNALLIKVIPKPCGNLSFTDI